MNSIRLTALGTLGAAAVLTLTGQAVPAQAATAGNPPEVKISEVVSTGTGCQKGKEPRVQLDSNGQRLTVEFPAFEAEAGQVPNDDGSLVWVSKANRSCQTNIRLTYSEGWSFAVTEAGGSGYADIARDANGRHIGAYHFAGTAETGGFYNVTGATRPGTYSYFDKVDTPSWSECGNTRALNINSKLQVDASKANRDSLSTMTIGSTTASLEWKLC
ncbi:hypothetical protein GCM10010124_05990 [Pilimelia terevasa]|uniref:Secreted protein n=1 Tax=Pilimelia terevasa TaxID=53372 RepID=A0A8J3FEC3_9ACTN|nr:DUF4360 domain-containing protein [Pilimelia terevasa]GGK16169.1 hypothetical protein GCM10010124_05990 [Pilimelia terevasa]